MENLVKFEELKVHFNNKKVFITGHTGFKGSWLTAILHLMGAKVKGYALAPESPHGLFSLIQNLNFCESIIADIRDRNRIGTEIQSFQPDFIFHLAAQPLVRRSYEIPAETFEVNAVGTANVLEAANKLKKKCTIVVITTDKVYKNLERDILYKEDDQLGGYDPYSASKACTELVVSSFRNSFFNPQKIEQHQKQLASGRAGNVIGGGDWSADRIIPDIVRALSANQTIEVRNPRSVRPWQHVLEPLGGYLLLAADLYHSNANFGEAYNFGPKPQDHLTVKELVEIAIDVWGKGDWKDTSSPGQPHEAGLLKLDISKANQELNWRPKMEAKDAIRKTIEWYRKPETERASFALDQVKQYFNL